MSRTKIWHSSKGKKKPVQILIKDLEFGINAINTVENSSKTVKDEQNIIRTKSVNIITNFYKKNEPIKANIIRSDFFRTKWFLKGHPELIVSRSDKGNNTVCHYEERYLH